MCGIVGVISEYSASQIKECNRLISHRGPDDEGYFLHHNLAFGHKRLSIQDLSYSGHQPMISEDKNFVIIYNGEIYNHWEIRELLKNKYNFKSTSDTETLLYGYIEFGSGILSRLNGIFSFAIYDKNLGELFIARDQFGVKPLYYSFNNQFFWFSSEIKSILALSFDKEININALQNYLTFLYSPGELTPFRKVLKLLPGHYLKLNISNFQEIEITKYYEIPFTNKRSKKSEKELIEELEERLIKAVERQMLSDVPVGFFLSGGLDSSCIVAIARKLYPNRDFNCYTIKTNDGDNMEEGFVNDITYARKVTQHLNVKLIEVESNVEIVRDFDKMIYYLDEPLADPAPLHVLNICKCARIEGQIVLLGGTGADDIFSGYRRHQALKIENYLKLVPRVIKLIVHNILQKVSIRKPLLRRLVKITQNITLTQTERLTGYFSWLEKEKVDQLFHHKYCEEVKKFNPSQILKSYLALIPSDEDNLNKLLFLEMKFFLVDHNLNYTDKMGMAESVEIRVPFLDKELVEFSTEIPPHLKLKGVTTKYILRKVMEKYLPHDVIYRPKSGFGAPVRKWIIKDMKGVINKYLSKDNINKREFFNYDEVQRLLHNNEAEIIDASYSIWALLAIESWMQQFYDVDKLNID